MPPEHRGGLLRDNVVVALGTGLSRVSGFVRIIVLSTTLGAAGIADAYNLANNTPNMVFELLLGGILTATLIPVFTAQFDDGDEDATSAVVSSAALVLIALSAIAVVAAPAVVRAYTLIAQDSGSDFQEAATTMARFLLPQIFFYGVTAVASALLNARNRFAAAAFAPALNNVIVIAVLIYVARRFDDEIRGGVVSASLARWLGIGTTAGIVIMALALVPALARSGIRLRWRPQHDHPAVRRVVNLSGWTIGYVVSNQIALFIVLALALDDQAGALTAYLYAYAFFQLPHGLLAVSIMTTFAPDLARSAKARAWRQFRSQMRLGMQLLGLLMAPAAAAYVVLAQPLVSLLRRGNFTAANVELTADVLACFSVGLVGFSIYLFVLRAFYALSDTRTPFRVNLFENAVNIVVALVLFPRFGVQGLAVSYAIAYLVSAVVAWHLLVAKVGALRGAGSWPALVRFAVAAVAMGAVLYVVTDRIDGALAQLAVAAPVGVIVYLGAVFGQRAVELRLTPEVARPLR